MMPHKEQDMNRREFLIGATALATAATLYRCSELTLRADRFADQFLPAFDWEHIDSIEWAAQPPLPRALRGISFNVPFGWGDGPEQVAQTVAAAQSAGAMIFRELIDDIRKPFEPSLGKYNDDVIDQIRGHSKSVSEQSSKKIKTIISLIDGFYLFRSDQPNPVWVDCSWPPGQAAMQLGKSELRSPYLRGYRPEDGSPVAAQQAIFIDEEVKDHVKARLRFLVDAFKDTSSICAWEIGNELSVPGLSPDRAQVILTQWYSEMIDTVREIDPERPILLGVAEPWLVDDQLLEQPNIVNTTHNYIDASGEKLRDLSDYLHHPKRKLPVVCQEIGMPSKFGCVGIPSDTMLSRFLPRVIEAGMYQNNRGGWSNHLGHFGLWQVGTHQDGFNVSEASHPYTWAFIQRMNESMKRQRAYRGGGCS